VLLKTFEVKKEWVDYNNHMNMAYYVLVFDQAWEVALEKFKMGGTAAKDLIEVQWLLKLILNI